MLLVYICSTLYILPVQQVQIEQNEDKNYFLMQWEKLHDLSQIYRN